MAFCGLTYAPDMAPTCASLLDPSAVSPFQVGNIPDACFFTITGIYSMRTVPPFSWTFDSLYNYIKSQPQYAAQEASGNYPPDPYNNRSSFSDVKTLSFQQLSQYQQQLSLFRTVYTFNLKAYTYAQQNNTQPIYYRFKSSSELSQFNNAMGLINKLYNVNELYPYTCLFFLPFPPFCDQYTPIPASIPTSIYRTGISFPGVGQFCLNPSTSSVLFVDGTNSVMSTFLSSIAFPSTISIYDVNNASDVTLSVASATPPPLGISYWTLTLTALAVLPFNNGDKCTFYSP